MANKSVLLISGNEKGFLANSLCEYLNKSNVITYSVTLDTDGLMRYIEYTELIIIMEDVNAEMHQVKLNSLKDYCYEHKRQVAFYANPEPIEKFKRIFPNSMIADTFVRPIDVPNVVEKIEAYINAKENHVQKKKILVVDDSGATLRTIMSWLEGEYQVALANSAASAFVAIEKDKPDLILLDYEMPVCSGAQFFEMLSGEPETKDIPVIFLTSRDDTETVKKVLDLKPKGYILKTTPEQTVLRVIGNFFKSLQ